MPASNFAGSSLGFPGVSRLSCLHRRKELDPEAQQLIQDLLRTELGPSTQMQQRHRCSLQLDDVATN